MEIINTIDKYYLLKQTSEPFDLEKDYDEIIKVYNILKNYLDKTKNALGISAPQLGIFKRMFMIKDEVFINPEILNKSGDYKREVEACMSFPDVKIFVSRYSKASVHYYTINKNLQISERFFVLKTPRAFLHEYDHLDGILHLDRFESKGYPPLEIVPTPSVRGVYKIHDINKKFHNDYFVDGENQLFFNQDKIIPEAYPDKILIGYKLKV